MTARDRLFSELADATDDNRCLAALRALQGVTPGEPLLNIRQLAERLGTCRSQIYRLDIKPELYVGSSPRFVLSRVLEALKARS